MIKVPERFEIEIRNHLIFNFSDFSFYPLILGIFGSPGNGKTLQIRTTLEKLQVEANSISAADLESVNAGEPGKLILQTYIVAASKLAKGIPQAIIIDDLDTTLGEWEGNTGTVNHQQILAQMMHLADSPTKIDQIDTKLRRVPFFITGNDFSKIYAPLRRPGRMFTFHWKPNKEEMNFILSGMYTFLSNDDINTLINEFDSVPVAFFHEILIRLSRRVITNSELFKKIIITDMVKNPKSFVEILPDLYRCKKINLNDFIKIGHEILHIDNMVNQSHLNIYGS